MFTIISIIYSQYFLNLQQIYEDRMFEFTFCIWETIAYLEISGYDW